MNIPAFIVGSMYNTENRTGPRNKCGDLFLKYSLQDYKSFLRLYNRSSASLAERSSGLMSVKRLLLKMLLLLKKQ